MIPTICEYSVRTQWQVESFEQILWDNYEFKVTVQLLFWGARVPVGGGGGGKCPRHITLNLFMVLN